MQLVAVLTRDEQLRAALVAVSCESLAQAMHVYLDGLGGGRRWALAPEIVDQALGAERLIRVQHEQRQQSALLVAPSATGRPPSETSSGPRREKSMVHRERATRSS
jgi:hypothetical protein